MNSIISGNKKRICFLCQKETHTEKHHIIHGTANRKISERYGLKVDLCQYCHRLLHDKNIGNMELKALAQAAFERTHTRAEWMRLFGRNYILDNVG